MGGSQALGDPLARVLPCVDDRHERRVAALRGGDGGVADAQVGCHRATAPRGVCHEDEGPLLAPAADREVAAQRVVARVRRRADRQAAAQDGDGDDGRSGNGRQEGGGRRRDARGADQRCRAAP
jgi:hypothetical protein